MKTKAIYAGSFDPLTIGHMDLIKRASKCFDLTIVIAANDSKGNGMFPLETRFKMVVDAVKNENIECEVIRLPISMTLAELAKNCEVSVLLRGVRNETDYLYETQMETINKLQGVETLYLSCDPSLSMVSSSLVRQFIKSNFDVSALVPSTINNYIKENKNI